jgi:hypothetical protein
MSQSSGESREESTSACAGGQPRATRGKIIGLSAIVGYEIVGKRLELLKTAVPLLPGPRPDDPALAAGAGGSGD